MKLLSTLICLAAVAGATTATAQTTAASAPERRHLLEFGLGESLNGSGDYSCLKSHLGYTRLLSRHLALTNRLAMVSGADAVYFGWNNGPHTYLPTSYHAVNVESEALYAPFGNDHRFGFAVGAGLYAGYTKQYDFEYAGYGLDGNYNPVFDYKPRNTRGFHVGYLASLNFDYAVDYQQRWLLGLKLALQNDTYANVLPGFQVKLGRRL